jgi:hypothetical protein
MVPHVYMDPMNYSPNGGNIYIQNGQQAISPQQQSPTTFPLYYSTSPPTPLTPWMSAVSPQSPLQQQPPPPPPPPYYMLSNHQQPQHFPFQQFI